MSEEPPIPTVAGAAARIRARDPQIRAFIHQRVTEAVLDAERLQREPPRSVLHGLPYSLKDLWDTAGIATTAGSWRYRDRVPTESSPVHRVFERAGAVLMGKSSLSDLGIVPEASNYFVGATCNPYDLTRTSGGSSGGAAAAVADGMAAFDWGSDFAGSIRLPAAYCGVYGIRLSTETWPVRGVFPELPPSLAWMNGQGPIAGSLGMLTRVLDVTAPALRTGPETAFEARGVSVYAPSGRGAGEWATFSEDVMPALRRTFGDVLPDDEIPAIEHARRIGTAIIASHFDDMMAIDHTPFLEGLAAAASAIVFRGRFGDRSFHPHTAAMLAVIALGRAVIYRDRAEPLALARALRESMYRSWDRGRVIVMPTCTFPAPRHGGSLRNQYLMAFTVLANATDATALAIPWGRFPNGLPRSIQLLGPAGSERALIAAAQRLREDG